MEHQQQNNASERKPTLLSIRLDTSPHVTTQQLADQAHVSRTEAYMVEIGGFVDPETTQKVVHAFVTLTGRPLRLGDIRTNNVATVSLPFTERAGGEEQWT